MIGFLSQRWQTSRWFKISVVLILLFIITGLVMQFSLGVDPRSGGTSVLGDQDTINDLQAGNIVVHSIELTTELSVVSFTSTAEVDVYFAYEVLTNPVDIDYLNANATLDQRTDQLSQWIEEQTNVSLVIIAPQNQDIEYRFEIRSFNPDQRDGLIYFSVGGFMYTLAILTLVVYLIMGELLPWLLYRGQEGQPPQ